MLRLALAASALLLTISHATAFEGRYQQGTGDFRQTAVIRLDQGGIYSVRLTVKSRLCNVELDATGKVVGGDLVAEVTAPNDPCKVTIAQRGATITIREDKCLNWHGAACDFNGTLRRQ